MCLHRWLTHTARNKRQHKQHQVPAALESQVARVWRALCSIRKFCLPDKALLHPTSSVHLWFEIC